MSLPFRTPALALADPERLVALDATGLLDPAPTGGASDAGLDVPALTRVARLAARALGAPVAQVNLVTADAQIPRAAYVDPAVAGGDPTAWRRPVSLAASLCQRVVQEGAPLVIDDARTDPRARENEAVINAGLGGYCAVPLRASGPAGSGRSELIIGSVCVVDFAPRHWTPADVTTLEDLAAIAAAEIARRTTERRAAAATTAAREQAEAVLASIGDAFYLLDRAWRFTEVNAAAEPLLQTTRAALLGRTLWEAFPDVAGSVFEGAYREAMATGRVTSAEAYFEPLGTWFDVRSYPWSGGLMVHFRDIGARKAAEAERDRLIEALGLERERLAAVFQQSPSFLAVLRGPDNVFDFVNDAYEQIVGHGRTLVGRPLFDALPETRGQGFDQYLDRVRATGESLVFRDLPVQLERAPGTPLEERFIDITYFPLVEPDGSHDAVIAHGTDVTEQVRARRSAETVNAQLEEQQIELELTNQQLQEQTAELELRAEELQTVAIALEARTVEADTARAIAEAARVAADAANLAKSQFLANMSHELRTPLNAIGGYVQLLELGLHGPVTDDQRGALGRVQKAQHRLLALINDVLNYAKLEGGRVEYDVRVVDLRDVVADVVPLVEPQIAAKGLAFDVELPGTPCAVWADREKLGQILVNLLSNAIKFTEPEHPTTGARGRVAVRLAAARPGTEDAVFLRVTDTGRGIPRDKQDAIFEPFVQVRTGYAQATEGTGLGLAISRDLARGMGGDLRVRSVEGEGAAFTVALRRAAAPGDAPGHALGDASGDAREDGVDA